MSYNNEKFADDLDQKNNEHHNASEGDKNHNDIEDKWNEIQEEYINAQPNLDTEDLYFEGGGFNGMLEKMSEKLGKSVAEIREEIQNW